ncbi:MAG: AAA family ATPase, partial [Firmicutes bacterium]|nr:AAA family ATPase [Bacillota bacterium]
DISQSSDVVQEKAAAIMRDIKAKEKALKADTNALDYKICMFAIGHYVTAIQEKYKDYPKAVAYLQAVSEDVLENINEFLDDENEPEDGMSELLPMLAKKNSEDITDKYRVNLIVDNSKTTGAPVIVDYNPTFYNLVGEVEYDSEFGNLTTDFMKIKGGLLHKANGGYLILQASDVLANVQSWEALRRVIKTKLINIESLREQLGAIAMPVLKPEPIPVSLKVVLIGSTNLYDMLHVYDDDFAKLFKVCADFDHEMAYDVDNVRKLARFIKSYSLKEEIKSFDTRAVARVVEYASRLVERQDKISTCFNQIAEILCEATVWADMDKKEIVTEEYVVKAVSEKQRRLNMYAEKYADMLDSGVIMIDTDGEKIGQINGLAVLDTGDFTFGTPTRITATTYMGKSGIINVEKEADMSGPTHNKGVQVISGYLGQTYAQDFPLTLSCGICFEQNYSGIDGDSASSTELYCIISSLAELPIKQGLAVTGSVNQRGEIQAIGGVTHKIEGFFDLCKRRGLTGHQGVIIPSSNIRDLVLKDEVIEAVKEGVFHIYPIDTIDEGIEHLMGVPAGKKDLSGAFPAGTVHAMVMEKLVEYNRKSLE